MFGVMGERGIGHSTIPALRSKQMGIAVGDMGTYDPQKKTINAISSAKVTLHSFYNNQEVSGTTDETGKMVLNIDGLCSDHPAEVDEPVDSEGKQLDYLSFSNPAMRVSRRSSSKDICCLVGTSLVRQAYLLKFNEDLSYQYVPITTYDMAALPDEYAASPLAAAAVTPAVRVTLTARATDPRIDSSTPATTTSSANYSSATGNRKACTAKRVQTPKRPRPHPRALSIQWQSAPTINPFTVKGLRCVEAQDHFAVLGGLGFAEGARGQRR